jgi:hypothetical protein
MSPGIGASPISSIPEVRMGMSIDFITYLLRRALGDLFLGPYSAYFGLPVSGSPLPSRGDRVG